MDIRVLKPSDIPHVQLTNITNLPENYFCKYYLYHAMSWPQLSYVAVDVSCAFSYITSISPSSPIYSSSFARSIVLVSGFAQWVSYCQTIPKLPFGDFHSIRLLPSYSAQ